MEVYLFTNLLLEPRWWFRPIWHIICCVVYKLCKINKYTRTWTSKKVFIIRSLIFVLYLKNVFATFTLQRQSSCVKKIIDIFLCFQILSTVCVEYFKSISILMHCYQVSVAKLHQHIAEWAKKNKKNSEAFQSALLHLNTHTQSWRECRRERVDMISMNIYKEIWINKCKWVCRMAA